MKIAFFTQCDYDALPMGCDVAVFPFFQGEAVSYNKEIKGITTFFRRLTELSKSRKTAIIAGADTDSYGSVRHSAAVCDGGKLLGISDMTIVSEGERYIGGGGLRVYDTHAGKIGVAVGRDIISSECVRSLAACGADVIVNVMDEITDPCIPINARAKAYEFGVPVAACCKNLAFLATADGEMAFLSPDIMTLATLDTGRDYHTITVRKRGKYRRKPT